MHGSVWVSYNCSNVTCRFHRNFPEIKFRSYNELVEIIENITSHLKFEKCPKDGCGKSVRQEIVIANFPNGI